MNWTAEQLAELKWLDRELRLSPSAIARRMGLSRNQISGKLYVLRHPQAWTLPKGLSFGEALRAQRLEAERLRAKRKNGAR